MIKLNTCFKYERLPLPGFHLGYDQRSGHKRSVASLLSTLIRGVRTGGQAPARSHCQGLLWLLLLLLRLFVKYRPLPFQIHVKARKVLVNHLLHFLKGLSYLIISYLTLEGVGF